MTLEESDQDMIMIAHWIDNEEMNLTHLTDQKLEFGRKSYGLRSVTKAISDGMAHLAL